VANQVVVEGVVRSIDEKGRVEHGEEEGLGVELNYLERVGER
jgi:hypothetical protein